MPSSESESGEVDVNAQCQKVKPWESLQTRELISWRINEVTRL